MQKKTSKLDLEKNTVIRVEIKKIIPFVESSCRYLICKTGVVSAFFFFLKIYCDKPRAIIFVVEKQF